MATAQEETFYIYKVRNTVNDKVYVGLTNNPRVRFAAHKETSQASKSRLYNDPLYVAMREIGVENFSIEVLEEGQGFTTMLGRESYWMRTLTAEWPTGYNKTVRKLTDEEAAMIRYDTLGLQRKDYAQMFGIRAEIVSLIQGNKPYRPYGHVTVNHLPPGTVDYADVDSKEDPEFRYYVYTYANSLTGSVFHAGVSTDYTTMFMHIEETRKGHRKPPRLTSTIRSIWQQGGKVVVRRVAGPLREIDARDTQKALMKSLKRPDTI